MTRPTPPIVTVAVEGLADIPVVERLLATVGLGVGPVHVLGGKDKLDGRLNGYNNAARHAPWLVLRDLDSDAACAPELVSARLGSPSAGMHFRIAVRATEAWLMADRQRLARFLGVPEARVSAAPEALTDPKRTLVDLARRSRFRAVRDDMVPARATSAQVGPGYTSRITEFVQEYWRPAVAARLSPSLAGCLGSLRTLTQN
jgi:hypothetical protein